MPKRPVVPADYIARRALWLPESSRYDWIMEQAALGGVDLPKIGESHLRQRCDVSPSWAAGHRYSVGYHHYRASGALGMAQA